MTELSVTQSLVNSSSSSVTDLRDKTDIWIYKRIAQKKKNIKLLELENRIFVLRFAQFAKNSNIYFNIEDKSDTGVKLQTEDENNKNISFYMLSKEYVCVKRLSRLSKSSETLTLEQKYGIAAKVLDLMKIQQRINIKNRNNILFKLEIEIKELDVRMKEIKRERLKFDKVIDEKLKNSQCNKVMPKRIHQYFRNQYKNKVELNQNLRMRTTINQLERKKILEEIRMIKDIGSISKMDLDLMKILIARDLKKIRISQAELLKRFELTQELKQLYNKFSIQVKNIQENHKFIKEKIEENKCKSTKLSSIIERLQKDLKVIEELHNDLLIKSYNYESACVVKFLKQKDSLKEAEILKIRLRRKMHI